MTTETLTTATLTTAARIPSASGSAACDLFYRCLDQRREKDWATFSCLYGRRLRRSVRRALFRYLPTGAERELDDSVQELWLRLINLDHRRLRARSEKELWRYLGSVAHSVVLDRRRRLRREGKAIDSLARSGRPLRRLPATPEHRVLARERLSDLIRTFHRSASGKRSRLQFRVMVLAYCEGYSSAEIAQLLEHRATPQQIDSLIHRFRRRMALRGIVLSHRCPEVEAA